MIPILHLRATRGLYGAERALLSLVEATPAPFETVVATIVQPGIDDPLSEPVRRLGRESLTFETSSKIDFALGQKVARHAAERGVQLLHAHDYKSLATALVAGKLASIPVVATYHGDTGATAALWAYERLARALGNAASAVIGVSRPLREVLARWSPLSQSFHIPNGIAPLPPIGPAEGAAARQRWSIENGQRVIAVVGRLSREKGHAVLFEALRRMRTRTVALIAGDGPERPALERAAKYLPVRLLGFVPPREVYAASDAVVLPSFTEGVPLVALEAMALGRPVIASAVGDLPEMLGGEAGILVPPGEPLMLADAIDALESRSAQEIARRAEARFRERYTAQVMAEAYVRGPYAEALRGRSAEPIAA